MADVVCGVCGSDELDCISDSTATSPQVNTFMRNGEAISVGARSVILRHPVVRDVGDDDERELPLPLSLEPAEPKPRGTHAYICYLVR